MEETKGSYAKRAIADAENAISKLREIEKMDKYHEQNWTLIEAEKFLYAAKCHIVSALEIGRKS